MKHTCGDCFHFIILHSVGRCRRFPPVLRSDGTPENPPVLSTDVECGEFKHLPGYVPAPTPEPAPIPFKKAKK